MDLKDRLPPLSWLLAMGLLSMMSVSFGGSMERAASFFVIISALLTIFYFVSKEEISVDEDLKNLDGDGFEKEG